MNKYQLLYIIDNGLAEESKNEIVDKFSALIESLGGTVEAIDKWGTKKFAYEIAGKTGTAEIGSDKSRVLAWFAGYRTGVGVDEARLVLVLLDIKNTEEFNSLKFQIAREMLK